MKQREKPGMPNLLAELRANPGSGYCSGGQFENFRRSWAHMIMPSGHRKSHFFIRSAHNIAIATSLCGLGAEARWLYGPGNWPSCIACKRAMKVRRISPT